MTVVYPGKGQCEGLNKGYTNIVTHVFFIVYMKQNTPDGREAYITPSIEVIKMENEGVIATSGEPYHPITRSYSGSTSTHSYNSASSSDLEDLINDILTVEN